MIGFLVFVLKEGRFVWKICGFKTIWVRLDGALESL